MLSFWINFPDKQHTGGAVFCASSFLACKVDDGEVVDITSESDLTEAIQYFQAGLNNSLVFSTLIYPLRSELWQ
jgi:hypothetical protein